MTTAEQTPINSQDAADLTRAAMFVALDHYALNRRNRNAGDWVAVTIRDCVRLGANADMIAAWTGLDRMQVCRFLTRKIATDWHQRLGV